MTPAASGRRVTPANDGIEGWPSAGKCPAQVLESNTYPGLLPAEGHPSMLSFAGVTRRPEAAGVTSG